MKPWICLALFASLAIGCEVAEPDGLDGDDAHDNAYYAQFLSKGWINLDDVRGRSQDWWLEPNCEGLNRRCTYVIDLIRSPDRPWQGTVWLMGNEEDYTEDPGAIGYLSPFPMETDPGWHRFSTIPQACQREACDLRDFVPSNAAHQTFGDGVIRLDLIHEADGAAGWSAEDEGVAGRADLVRLVFVLERLNKYSIQLVPDADMLDEVIPVPSDDAAESP